MLRHVADAFSVVIFTRRQTAPSNSSSDIFDVFATFDIFDSGLGHVASDDPSHIATVIPR